MTATLTLTPWAHQALSLDEMRELGYRAVSLHCRLRVGGKSPGGPWSVKVHDWATNREKVGRYQRYGHLADLMHAALDQYEKEFVFTPEELSQIQRQSA